MCLRINRRNTTSAGVPCRPRLLLLGWRLPRASYTAATSASSASTASACSIQSSRRSPTSAAIRPSPKLRCARRISIMLFTPRLCRRIRAQQVMIEFTNGLDRPLQLLIIGERAANLGDALAPYAELPRASTGVGYCQNEDVIAFAARACWAALGEPDGPRQQRAAQQLTGDRKLADELFAFVSGLFSNHSQE